MSPLLFQTTQPYVGRITVTDLYRVDSRALTACCNYSSVAQVFQFSKSIILTASMRRLTSLIEWEQDRNPLPQTRHLSLLSCEYPALFTRLILASVCSPIDDCFINPLPFQGYIFLDSIVAKVNVFKPSNVPSARIGVFVDMMPDHRAVCQFQSRANCCAPCFQFGALSDRAGVVGEPRLISVV